MKIEDLTAIQLLKEMDNNKIHALIACNLLIDCVESIDGRPPNWGDQTKSEKEFWIEVKSYIDNIK